MEIIKENTNELTGRLRIKLSEEDYSGRVDKQLRELRKTIKMKGFRPGKVPVNLIKKMYGKEILADEIMKLADEIIQKFKEENNYNFISRLFLDQNETKFDIEKEKEFELVYDYAIYPELDINLEDLKIPYYKITPTEEDIEKKIEITRYKYGKKIEPEKICEDCSFIINAVELNEKGEPKENGINVEKRTVIFKYLTDKGKEIFKDKKKDDKIKLNIKEAFGNETDLSMMLDIKKEELDEISDTFEITIVEINKFVPAEINEEFYEKAFGKDKVHNEEELKQEVIKILENELAKLSDSFYKQMVKYEILKKINFDLPENFIKEKIFPFNDNYEENKVLYNDQIKFEYISKILFEKLNLEFSQEDIYDYLIEKIKDALAIYGPLNLERDFYLDLAKKEFEKMDEQQKEATINEAIEYKLFMALKETNALEQIEVTRQEFDKKIEEFDKYIREKYNIKEKTEEEDIKEKEDTEEKEATETIENKEPKNETETETTTEEKNNSETQK